MTYDSHNTQESRQHSYREREMFLPWVSLKLWLLLVTSAMIIRSSRGTSSSPAKLKQNLCPRTCGGIEIPYPFGIGEDCSFSDGFKIECNNSSPNDIRPFKAGLEITGIDLEYSPVQVMQFISYQCYNTNGLADHNFRNIDLLKTPYLVSNEDNVFVAVGCDTLGYIYADSTSLSSYLGGCMTWCDQLKNIDNGSCTGTSCCTSPIRDGVGIYFIEFDSWSKHKDILDFNPCSYGFIVKKDYYNFSIYDLTYTDRNRKFPVVLDWAIGNLTCEEAQRNKTTYACVAENSDCSEAKNGNEYVCKCSKGYKGNPYLQDGCQDIDECKEGAITCNGNCVNTNGSYYCVCPPGTIGNATTGECSRANNGFSTWAKLGLGIAIGLPFLFMFGSWIFWMIQKRELRKLKEDFFRQNGGLFLQEQISTNQVKTFKIYTLVEMENATNKFNQERVLGKGGNGIVYKGSLQDGTTVAIKKSMMVEESKSKEFANEMLILSQINHVNVVKLLGCCLEVEVPMLVYEYIPNGTLFELIHSERLEHQVPWDLRLGIGVQSARALSYLHTEAHPPIPHGDIKSSNILLGDNLTAKVSDFGTSTFAPKDKSRFMTLIQGTYGYLDPEYLQTGELTEKSDVYSFGVVMVELLTGKKAVYRDEEKNEKNLGFEFISYMKEGKLMEILDPQFMDDCTSGITSNSSMEEIKVVVDVALQCLNVTAEERPNITQVYVVLEGLRRSETHPWVQQNTDELESLMTKKQQKNSSFKLNSKEYSSISQLILEVEDD